jgi:eukaryotic-like serine/threonine-protein kinase
VLGGVAVATLALVAIAATVFKPKQPTSDPVIVSQPSPAESVPNPTPSVSPSPIVESPSPSPEPPPPSPEPIAESPSPEPTVEPAPPQPSPTQPPSGTITPGGSVSVPGIPTGASERQVTERLGAPASEQAGYWPNTRSVLYDLGNGVNLGYSYDRDSNRVRQTEASFPQSADPLVMRVTLNGMLSGRSSEEIEAALRQVRDRQTNQYSFSQNGVEGVIERDSRDRIYIGVWDADLH